MASIQNNSAFFANELGRNDDDSTSAVAIGFDVNFFGTTYSETFVNNNGNITFDRQFSTFTPFGMASVTNPMIAPFFGDVDTRANGSGTVHYGQGSYSGRDAFGVTWGDSGSGPGVGYFDSADDKLNKFQLLLVDRSDVGVGDFDIHFFYDSIEWETGDASEGTGGLGGTSASAGYSNGAGVFDELDGSLVNGAFLDGGPNSLASGSNVGIPMQFSFQARNGDVTLPPPPNDNGGGGGGSNGAVPEPSSGMIWLTLGAVIVAGRRYKALQTA